MEEVYRRQFEQSEMDASILDNIDTKADARVKSAVQQAPPTYLTGLEHEEEFVDERNLPQLPPI
jgi:hypothetical protein